MPRAFSLFFCLILAFGAQAAEPPPGFIHLPAGAFAMGSAEEEAGRNSDEGPRHEVGLSAFAIGACEVTQGEWVAIMGTNPSRFKGDSLLPVDQVSWYDALVYCNKRSLREGLSPCYRIKGSADPERWGRPPTKDDAAWNAAQCDFRATGYRLPTEAEWEYACRGESATATAFGETLDSSRANFDGNQPYRSAAIGPYLGKTAIAASYSPNDRGLFDMHGNLCEWCWDWYLEDYYARSPSLDPRGGEGGQYRSLRGGSWNDFGYAMRSAYRSSLNPGNRDASVGLRLVRGY